MVVGVAYAIPVALRRDAFWADDALFYPQVALNIIRTGSSSFNGGVTHTNGYHPLWMCFNLLAAILSSGNRTALVWILTAFEAALIALSAIVYRRFAKLSALQGIVGLGMLLALLGSGEHLWGLEAHLSGFLIIASVYELLVCLRDETGANQALLGILLGLTMLARLDNVFFGAAALIAASASQDLRIFAQRALRIGLPASLVVLPYLLLNYFQYGRLVPISGAIKSSFPHVTGRLMSLGTPGVYTTLCAGLGVALWRTGPVIAAGWSRVLAALSFGTLGLAAYLVLFAYHLTGNPWEQVLGLVNLVVLVDVTYTLLLNATPEHRRRALDNWASALATIAVAGTIVMNWYTALNIHIRPRTPGQSWCTEEVAQWMNSNLPPRSRVLVFDSPGRLAFDSNMSIVPLDGLMNDYAFAHTLSSRGIMSFIEGARMEYYLGPIVENGETRPWGYATTVGGWDSEKVEVSGPLSHTSAGSFVLPRSDLLLRAQDLSPGCRDLGIWRLPP